MKLHVTRPLVAIFYRNTLEVPDRAICALRLHTRLAGCPEGFNEVIPCRHSRCNETINSG